MKRYLAPLLLAVLFITVLGSCRKRSDQFSLYHFLPGDWTLTHIGADINGNNIPDPDELTPVAGTLPVPVDISFNKDLTGNARISYDSYSFNVDFIWGLKDSEQILFTARGLDTTEYFIHSFETSHLTVYDPNLEGGTWELFARK
jgi:hypothetical protein